MAAVIGLIVVSALAISVLPLTLFFVAREWKALTAATFEHLNHRPHVIGKTEEMAKAELAIKEKEIGLREKEIQFKHQLQAEESWARTARRRELNRQGVTAAEMIESDVAVS